MREFWVSSGHHMTQRLAGGGLAVTDEMLLAYLARPELVPPEEACDAERALHARLMASPAVAIGADELARLADPDGRENWGLFLGFRDRLLAAPTIEAAYVAMARNGFGGLPPLFIDQLVHLILRNALDGCDDPFVLRAGELFFRPQKASVHEGQLMLADAETLEGLGPAGPQSPLAAMLGQSPVQELDVMTAENAWTYWSRSDAFTMVMNLGGDAKARQGLARAMEAWLSHICGVSGKVEPVAEARDADWRWFIGLDAEGTALGNRLWKGEALSFDDAQRVAALFRLELKKDSRLDPERSTRPVYLILGMGADKTIRMKPQNLVAGLPWRMEGKTS